LFGTLFIPSKAEAGIFSSLLGGEAYADAEISANSVKLPEPGSNSQNITLLEANVSSASIFQDKKEKETAKKEENTIDVDQKVNIVSNNALLPEIGPLAATGGMELGFDSSFGDTSVYVVRSGDTISTVAEMFGVTADTILSANDLKKGDKLKEGDVLLILPFSGIEHTVTKGQTLKGIANLYKIDLNEILFVNDIDADAKLAIGEKLIIPGAGMLSETKPGSSTKPSGSYASMPSILGYFKNPVPNGIKSRGITSKHKGVDIAAKTGTPIYASAPGKVLAAKIGWNGGYGNMIILQHPNGTKTLYAHMSKLGTTTGAQVSQGQVIGYVGNTGRSTGPHLHFEVLGAKNPF
jgi:LysM repeat protein